MICDWHDPSEMLDMRSLYAHNEQGELMPAVGW